VNRKQRAPVARRRPLLGLLAFVAAVLLYEVVFGSHGLGRYFALRDDLTHRSQQAYRRIARNRSLDERLHGLRTDEMMIEEAARSTLGVVHDDEIVLVFTHPRGSRRR
jgi:cell division protein FtsB